MSDADSKSSKKRGDHAGPRSRANQPDVPQPSHAERSRTLVYRHPTGYLSTHSKRYAGFPFGSVMPYALDDAGRPLFLISKMAMHTRNLDADPRASLLVPDEDAIRNPLGAGRVTVVGNAEAVPADELESVRETYLERHDNARYWAGFDDFGFYRLEPVGVYFVGGFGVMGWVEAEDYSAASHDPLADASAGIIEHMNDDHRDALARLAARYANLETDEAAMTAVDRLGFHLRVQVDGRMQGCRIAFTREVRSAEEARAVFVEMLGE